MKEIDKTKPMMDSYIQSLDEIHAPLALRKEILMKNEFRTKQKKRTGQMVLASLLSAAVLIPAADTLVYAATGNGVIHTILITINGKNEKLDMKEYKNEDGSSYYSGQIKGEDGSEVSLTIEDPDTLKNMQLSMDETEAGMEIQAEGDPEGSVTYSETEMGSESE